MSSNTSANTGRSKLDFVAAVRRVFSYLSEYGFEEFSTDEFRVTFARQDWNIVIFYVPFEFDLGVAIGISGEYYEIHEFAWALDLESFSKLRPLNVGTADEVLRGLEALSERLKKYGADALAGDRNIMRFMADCREKARRKMAEESDKNAKEGKN